MNAGARTLGYLSAAPRVSTRPDAEAGGPRSHVLGTIRAFEALGWRVERFIVGDRLPARASGRGSEEAISGSKARTLAADLARIGMGAANTPRARRAFGGKVDWVYERFAVLQALGRTFQRAGTPWILETNGFFSEEAKAERASLVLTGVANRREISAYQHCDVLVCVTEALREVVIEKAGVDPAKILVVPNGVDTSFFDPAMHEPRRLFEGFTVGFLGSLLAWQGVDRLLSAAAQLNREGVPIHVAVVGDGPMRGEWERLAGNLGLGERVRFVGRVPADEAPGYVAGFDAGFSGQQGLKMGAMYHSPLKLYEYLAMGKPAIASAHDDARQLAKGTGAGYLFAPGDEESLKRAIEESYLARASAGEVGFQARDEVVRNHSWVARVEGMIPRVEAILAGRK